MLGREEGLWSRSNHARKVFLPHFQTLMLPKTIVHSEVCEALKNDNQLHLRLGNRQKEVVGSFKAKIILDN